LQKLKDSRKNAVNNWRESEQQQQHPTSAKLNTANDDDDDQCQYFGYSEDILDMVRPVDTDAVDEC